MDEKIEKFDRYQHRETSLKKGKQLQVKFRLL